MVKTPTVEKLRKSVKTPKTMPKKLSGTPTTGTKGAKSKSLLERKKIEFDPRTSLNVASFCTPGRTTRSMAKITSNDMPPPSLPYVTPLKRKTFASTKSSSKKTDGEFVRPLARKSKRINLNHDEDASSDSAEYVEDRKSARTHKANDLSEDISNDTMEKSMSRKSKRVKEDVVSSENSEEDLPSVSMLSMKSGRKRNRKLAQNSIESSNDDDSDGQLEMNTSGQFVLAPKTENEHSESNDETLPSVSFLGNLRSSIGQFVRRSLLKKADQGENSESGQVKLSEGNEMPSNRKRNRKSAQNNDVESSDENMSSRLDMNISGQFVQSKKSKLTIISNASECDAEVVDHTVAKLSPKQNKRASLIRTPKSISSTDDIAESDKNEIESDNTREQFIRSEKYDDIKKDNPKEESPMSVYVSAANSNASTENGEEMELLDVKSAKPVRLDRMSVIDLTDSPMMPSQSELNRTFEKIDEVEESSAKDQTYENNETVINDKTFSPIPSSNKKKEVQQKSTPISSKKGPTIDLKTKSTGKVKPQQLKRLQSTPFLKPKNQNNLVASGKFSSAKKSKMAEAAVELIDGVKPKAVDVLSVPKIIINSPKNVNTLKVPKTTVDSPKVFKFGSENNEPPVFRFSLVAPHLKAADHNGKKNVKSAPNFKDMHNRMFKKIESIEETRNRHEERAKLLLSGKKPTQQQKPVQKTTNKMIKLNFNTSGAVSKKNQERGKNPDRLPLAHANRARMTDEDRQERRKQLFKQGNKRSPGKKNSVPEIKGVRMNRRFELMMKNRNAAK